MCDILLEWRLIIRCMWVLTTIILVCIIRKHQTATLFQFWRVSISTQGTELIQKLYVTVRRALLLFNIN